MPSGNIKTVTFKINLYAQWLSEYGYNQDTCYAQWLSHHKGPVAISMQSLKL